jgi:hypothetical protein
MFTKEKLEAWIEVLNHAVHCTREHDDRANNENKEKNTDLILDLTNTLNKLHASMTSDNSI